MNDPLGSSIFQQAAPPVSSFVDRIKHEIRDIKRQGSEFIQDHPRTTKVVIGSAQVAGSFFLRVTTLKVAATGVAPLAAALAVGTVSTFSVGMSNIADGIFGSGNEKKSLVLQACLRGN